MRWIACACFVPSLISGLRSAGRAAGYVPGRADSSVAPKGLGTGEYRQALPRNDKLSMDGGQTEGRLFCTEAAVQSAQADFV
jgi:hypothetical protein